MTEEGGVLLAVPHRGLPGIEEERPVGERLRRTIRVSENPASENGRYVNLDHSTQDEQVDQVYPENASTHRDFERHAHSWAHRCRSGPVRARTVRQRGGFLSC